MKLYYWFLNLFQPRSGKRDRFGVGKSAATPFPVTETFYISDNMGGFDGYLIDFRRGDRLACPGWYRVRELGDDHIYWKKFDYIPRE